MKKRYMVFTTVWHLPSDYDLKQGDMVEIIDQDQHEVCIINTYIQDSVWVNREDFNTHCEELK